jgi:hypothetical protein
LLDEQSGRRQMTVIFVSSSFRRFSAQPHTV